MNETILNKQATLDSLPTEWEQNLLPAINNQLAKSRKKLVVLDDDPTGTQTIHGLAVLTEWEIRQLQNELSSDAPGFYILTNSRSMTADDAYLLNIEIGMNLRMASHLAQVDYTLVSRSDSTLRGHFPLELEALTTTLEQPADIWILDQFFLEGGRYTLDDVHYVAEDDELVPASQTPFARDKAFGYTKSNLKEWVEEKSEGQIKPDSICSISIQDLREGGPQRVTQKLLSMPTGSVCVINSANYRDQEVFVNGLLAAEEKGRSFMYRTAASFVRPRVGQGGRDLLTAADMTSDTIKQAHGGLTIVGSYVPKTTAQLNKLLEAGIVQPIELNVSQLLDETWRASLIAEANHQINRAIQSGTDVVVYTSRKLVAADDAAESLAIGNIVSDSLVKLVKMLSVQPRYLIAKGGITSSDIATKGLGIKRAIVQGQILPGIPVWRTQADCRYPDISYVIFPGNVGDENALLEAIRKFQVTP